MITNLVLKTPSSSESITTSLAISSSVCSASPLSNCFISSLNLSNLRLLVPASLLLASEKALHALLRGRSTSARWLSHLFTSLVLNSSRCYGSHHKACLPPLLVHGNVQISLLTCTLTQRHILQYCVKYLAQLCNALLIMSSAWLNLAWPLA